MPLSGTQAANQHGPLLWPEVRDGSLLTVQREDHCNSSGREKHFLENEAVF